MMGSVTNVTAAEANIGANTTYALAATQNNVPNYESDPVVYNAMPTQDSPKDNGAYDYMKKLTPESHVMTWGGSNYNNVSGKDDQKVTTFQDTPEVKTDMQEKIPDNSLQYHLEYDGNNQNYQSISNLSQTLARHSDKEVRSAVFTYHRISKNAKENKAVNSHDYYLTYTNTSKSITVKPKAHNNHFDQNRFKEVRDESIKNNMASYTKPKVTYDKNGYASFLQSTASGHGAYWYSFDYTSNLQGYTFKDGKQLPLTYFLKSTGDASAYFLGVAHKYREMDYSIDSKYELPYSGGAFVKGSTSYFLTNKGIYAFIPNGSGMSNWNWPMAVLLPMSLVKDEYHYLFEFPNHNNVLPATGKGGLLNDNGSPKYMPKEDINKLGEDDLFHDISDSLLENTIFNKKLTHLESHQLAEKLVHAAQDTSKFGWKVFEEVWKDRNLNINLVTKLLNDYVSTITPLLTTYMASHHLLSSKASTDLDYATKITSVGEWWSIDLPVNFLQVTRDKYITYRNNMTEDNAADRQVAFETVRSRSISAKKKFVNGAVAEATEKIQSKGGLNGNQIAAITIGCTAVASLLAIGFWNKFQSAKLAIDYGIKITRKSTWARWLQSKFKK